MTDEKQQTITKKNDEFRGNFGMRVLDKKISGEIIEFGIC